MYQKLEQINRDLIKLLGERMEILTELNAAAFTPSNNNFTEDLIRANLPNQVWQDICHSCDAALPVTQSISASEQSRVVTIIGGCGLMGRWFGQRLSTVGHEVRIIDQDNWHEAQKLVDGCDLVLISVPIDCTIAVIERISPFLSPLTALADITSLKSNIVATMLTTHAGPVMGLHPMFGPSAPSFTGQNMVICPGRQEEAFEWLLRFIQATGGNLIKTTPENHDQMMVFIQSIRQFSTFTLGHFFKQESFDINLSHQFSTPSFRQEIESINRLFSQSPSLIIDIILATPERRETISRLAQTYAQLADLVVEQQRDTLIEEFRDTSSYWQSYINAEKMGKRAVTSQKTTISKLTTV